MKKALAILLSLVLVLGLVACGGSASSAPAATAAPAAEAAPAETTTESAPAETTEAAPAAEPELTIKFASAGPASMDNPMNAAELYFEQILEERSNGRIEVEMYMAGALGNVRTVMEGIQLGTIEMGEVENGVMATFVPSAAIWDLPFMFDSYEHAYAVMDGELGDTLRQDFFDLGIRHLGYNNGGFRHFFSNKRPADNAENIKGLKIRVMETKIMMDTINNFGASAVPIAFGELYTALQQGVVDGQDMPVDMFISQSYYEVQQYMVPSGHFFMPRQYLINEDFYQSLSEEFQQLISECAMDACLYQRQLMEEYDAMGREMMLEHGMEIVDDFDYDYFTPIGKALWPEYYEMIGNGDAALGEARCAQVREIGDSLK